MRKRILLIATTICTLFLCASCDFFGDFIDENNALCKVSWSLQSSVEYTANGDVIGTTDYSLSRNILTFSALETWIFESEAFERVEMGGWSSEQIPADGCVFYLTLYSPSSGFIVPEGHSGEEYEAALSNDGNTLTINHYHIDSNENRKLVFKSVPLSASYE